ncbi:NCLDV major capsid protein [Indivirus ILV1]|uniref:NCLDV major capsid protein n=1 Tax=Indivirus ILV1 TaxID=1977633 RepID=A0A1V0SCD8_9VIRU|nr:NCLDV major capsid protein [Indivirus ILV1]
MAGGLIQLVAYSKQDIFLTNDPQITFFKIVYRRHTNFTLEVIPQNFLHHLDFGKRVSSVISRNGDLIRNIQLVIDLPSIPIFRNGNNNDILTKFAWVRRIGYAIIKTVEVEIGGELIDRQYGDWLNIWHELTISDKVNLDKILGNIKELTDYTSGKKSYRLMIPLRFWFNRIAGLALPIVSLQYNNVKITVELNEFDKCYLLSPTNYIEVENAFVNFKPYEYIKQSQHNHEIVGQFVHFDILERKLYYNKISENAFTSKYDIIGVKSKFTATPTHDAIEKIYKNRNFDCNSVSIKKSFLLVEYAFLDDDERLRFLKARHEYLIEQLIYNGETSVSGLHQSFMVGFTNPCKELLWVTQLRRAQQLNQTFNYTDSIITNKDGNYLGKNMIKKETILYNGHERLSMRNSKYFTDIQVYQNHSHAPSEGINVYSFALHPENHQPSGTANLSEIENVNLRVSINPKINFNSSFIRIYGIVYNIFRIANGVSGIMFALDYQNN